MKARIEEFHKILKEELERNTPEPRRVGKGIEQRGPEETPYYDALRDLNIATEKLLELINRGSK